MRLNGEQITLLKRLAAEEAGADARLLLFGSRLDDAARGGDVDLLLQLPEAVSDPAPLAARLSARASRALDGRHVDVVLSAPNLKHLSIHEAALCTGVEL